MGKIFLIRHGEVEWNRKSAYVGATDVPLNAAGQAQAVQLASRLDGEQISAVYSSDLTRARKTAEIIAERLGLKVHLTRELQEVDYGEWEGVLESEAPQRDPDIYRKWRANPVEIRIPGGETFGELRDRAFPAFCRIAQAHSNENVVIVSHKSTNRVILTCLLGINVNYYRRIGQGNACINVIEVREDGSFAVEAINECCHSPVNNAVS